MTAEPSTLLIDVLKRVRSDPKILQAAAVAASSHGRPIKALPQEEVLRHIVSLLDAMVATLAGDPGQLTEALRAADDLASDRAEQGVTLPVLLDGVLAGRTVMLEAIISSAQEVITAQEMLALLGDLDYAVNSLQNRMILAYRNSEQERGRTVRSMRVEALRELLDGGPLSWAEEAGLELGTRQHCLLADVSTPREARRIEPLLGTAEGISGIVHGLLCRITPRLTPSTDGLDDVLVVVSPAVPIDQLAITYELCREALDSYRAHEARGIRQLTSATLEVATRARPDLGRILAAQMLAKLDPSEEFHRLIAQTARSYLAHGSRTERTAASLHVHPNTVKYRIRRFGELIGGFDLSEPSDDALCDAVNWWWALSTWLD